MYDTITLSNGVRIVSEHMDGVRSAAVGIWVGAGSRCEKRGEEGSAHFIEHMLFKGTSRSDAAMLAGRLVWGLASLALYGVVGNAFTFPMFLAGAFVNAVPGILLHLVLIPAIMFGLERSGVLRKERQE